MRHFHNPWFYDTAFYTLLGYTCGILKENRKFIREICSFILLSLGSRISAGKALIFWNKLILVGLRDTGRSWNLSAEFVYIKRAAS